MAGNRWVAVECGCIHDQVMGKKRPVKCDCGNFFVKPESEAKKSAPRRRSSSDPDRYWDDALAKVAEEGCCRICKRTDRKLDAAHVLGREHDEPRIGAGGRPLKELYVDPDRIFPACGPFPLGCHGLTHQKAVDILPVLTLEEQVQAVKDAGGIRHALTLLAPVEHREEVEASAYSEAPA